MSAAIAALAGCAARQATVAKAPANVPLQTASKSDLLAKYNQIAASIKTINAGIAMHLTATSAYTGVVKSYTQVNGFILAEKPDTVRVIGQAPVVGTKIFDMVSDGKRFSISIPSKNQFLTGPAKLEKPSDKPVENLRPQHLMEAIFWQPVPEADPVLFEQAMDQGSSDYVLTVITRGSGPADWKISRKIWFERVGLTMARIETYGDDGQLESDIHYAQWEPFSGVQYPKSITLDRPMDGYTLAITVTKLTANAPLQPSQFALQQPAGAQVVHVGESADNATPAPPAANTRTAGSTQN